MPIEERRMRKHIYPEVGTCIYCRSDGEGLGLRTEHIIPGGLGGRLELPRASCHRCEAETSAFERRVLRGWYGHTRPHFGVRREKASKKSWPATLPVSVSDEMGSVEVEVPRELHPHLSMVVRWRAPEIFVGIPPDDSGIRGALLDGMSDKSLWKKAADVARRTGKNRVSLNRGGTHVDDFARFLAKIGHSFAVAECGLTRFSPFLQNAVLNKRPMYLSYYVGMTTVGGSLTPDVHEINIRKERVDARTLLVVRIQLFADIGLVNPKDNSISSMPAYDVVAGEVLE